MTDSFLPFPEPNLRQGIARDDLLIFLCNYWSYIFFLIEGALVWRPVDQPPGYPPTPSDPLREKRLIVIGASTESGNLLIIMCVCFLYFHMHSPHILYLYLCCYTRSCNWIWWIWSRTRNAYIRTSFSTKWPSCL